MTAEAIPRWTRPKVRYGPDDSYRLAADWLKDCAVVADWGCGGGYFRRFLRPETRYVGVDGTWQARSNPVVADLRTYRERTAGILLRHVVDNSPDGLTVLRNAVEAFERRLVVVTCTPDAETSGTVRLDVDGYPISHYNPDDLRAVMGKALVSEVLTGFGPEHVYLCERDR